jgi:hypothetical protein
MDTEQSSPDAGQPEPAGPVRPGSPMHRLLEWIAREIARDAAEGEAAEGRERPRRRPGRDRRRTRDRP